MSKPAAVLLRDLDAQGERSHPFEPAHAERLLGYPGTRWVKVEAPVPTEKKPVAAAPTKKAASAAPSPAPDPVSEPPTA